MDTDLYDELDAFLNPGSSGSPSQNAPAQPQPQDLGGSEGPFDFQGQMEKPSLGKPATGEQLKRKMDESGMDPGQDMISSSKTLKLEPNNGVGANKQLSALLEMPVNNEKFGKEGNDTEGNSRGLGNQGILKQVLTEKRPDVNKFGVDMMTIRRIKEICHNPNLRPDEKSSELRELVNENPDVRQFLVQRRNGKDPGRGLRGRLPGQPSQGMQGSQMLDGPNPFGQMNQNGSGPTNQLDGLMADGNGQYNFNSDMPIMNEPNGIVGGSNPMGGQGSGDTLQWENQTSFPKSGGPPNAVCGPDNGIYGAQGQPGMRPSVAAGCGSPIGGYNQHGPGVVPNKGASSPVSGQNWMAKGPIGAAPGYPYRTGSPGFIRGSGMERPGLRMNGMPQAMNNNYHPSMMSDFRPGYAPPRQSFPPMQDNYPPSGGRAGFSPTGMYPNAPGPQGIDGLMHSNINQRIVFSQGSPHDPQSFNNCIYSSTNGGEFNQAPSNRCGPGMMVPPGTGSPHMAGIPDQFQQPSQVRMLNNGNIIRPPQGFQPNMIGSPGQRMGFNGSPLNGGGPGGPGGLNSNSNSLYHNSVAPGHRMNGVERFPGNLKGTSQHMEPSGSLQTMQQPPPYGSSHNMNQISSFNDPDRSQELFNPTLDTSDPNYFMAEPVTSWKNNAGEFRKNLLQNFISALKEVNTNGDLTSAKDIEQDAFNTSETKEEYQIKLVTFLASVYRSHPKPDPVVENPDHKPFDSKVLDHEETQDGAKSEDFLGVVDCDPDPESDQKPLTNTQRTVPILSEMLPQGQPGQPLKTSPCQKYDTSGGGVIETKPEPLFDTNDSIIKKEDDKGVFSNSLNLDGIKSPVSSSPITGTPLSPSAGGKPAMTTSSPSLSSICPSSNNPGPGLVDPSTAKSSFQSPPPNFSLPSSSDPKEKPQLSGPMPTVLSQTSTTNSGTARNSGIRRSSGKGPVAVGQSQAIGQMGNLSGTNNPHSVDSGIGSPRSNSSSTLYSPKIHGTSPSLVNSSSENNSSSPDKTG